MLDYLQSYQALLIYEYIEKIFIKVSFEPHMVLVSKKPSSFLVDSYERNDVLPMDDASGCQNDVREVVCMWRDVM